MSTPEDTLELLIWIREGLKAEGIVMAMDQQLHLARTHSNLVLAEAIRDLVGVLVLKNL